MILKTEINESNAVIGQLAQWRLVLVSALTAVGLGISPSSFEHGYLLLFMVPMVCLYVDLLIYARANGVHEIAKFIRSAPLPATTTNDAVLVQAYERYINRRRHCGLTRDYQRLGDFLLSIMLSVVVPLLTLGVQKFRTELFSGWACCWFLLPLLGAIAVCLAFRGHLKKIKELGNDDDVDGGSLAEFLAQGVLQGSSISSRKHSAEPDLGVRGVNEEP